MGENLDLDQQLVGSTDQLLSTLGSWQRATGPQRAALAAARMLPRRLRAGLPAQASCFVERELRFLGDAQAQASDDLAGGRNRSAFKLLGDAGSAELDIILADPNGSVRDLGRRAGRQVAFDAMRAADQLVTLDRLRVQWQPAGQGGTPRAAGSVIQGG